MLAAGGTLTNCMQYLKDNPEENGAGATTATSNAAISSTADGTNATNSAKKERPPLDLEIPSYVTKIEDTKSGGKYLCNPCQSHCNSDIQLSQHLASKKHLEKVSGKKNSTTNVRGSGPDWRDSQYGSNNSAHTANIFCEVCKLNFSSQSVLQTHLSGSKHQRKLKSLEVLKTLEETQSCFEYDTQSGEIRCTVCDVVFHSPQHLSRHVDSERHKEAERKRENGEEGGTPAKKHCARKIPSTKPNQNNSQVGGVGSEVTSTTGNSASGTTNSAPQKERPPINVPACVTKLEDTKAGGNYLCNPCQAHCNSDIQLTQHLSSKKHLDKCCLFCDLCNTTFTSQGLLEIHFSGAKHERKQKFIDVLKSLEETEPYLDFIPGAGEVRCLVCDSSSNSPQALLRHIANDKHKEAKVKKEREGGLILPKKIYTGARKSAKGTSVLTTTTTSISTCGASFSSQSSKKERSTITLDIPAYVTKLEEGGIEKYLCNPCQTNCNSDTQLGQHLSSKKHSDKLSGKKNPPSGRGNWRGGWRMGHYARGRGGGSGRGGASMHKWDSQANAILSNNSNAGNYSHSFFPDSSLPSSNFNDSYGLSSLGRGPVNDAYTFNRSSNTGRGGRGGGGTSGRNEPTSHHSEGPYVKGTSYNRTENYSRPDYSDYSSARSENLNSYNRSSVDNTHQAYRSGQGMSHTSGRGMPYPYTPPMSHNFVSGGTILH